MSGVFHSYFYGMAAMLDHWLTKIFPNEVTTGLSTVNWRYGRWKSSLNLYSVAPCRYHFALAQ
jgi:hypothetical protein